MKQRRYSRQREMIYRSLCGRSDHPSAEMLYRELKSEESALSLGTVYRNLNQLAADGLALRMPFPVDRYDANTAEHPHFYCTCCCRLYDLPLSIDQDLCELAAAQGYQAERLDLIFRGLCPACKNE